MRFVDLFAGIGGASLGLEWAGMQCVGQVEIDSYCRRILENHWPGLWRWDDIKTLDPRETPAAELIFGSYPCQPFSQAGLRRGAEDDRHLWPFIVPVIAAVRPAWCLFENVAGHVTLGLDQVLSDLEGLGYAAWPLVVPACGVDAPHIRSRVWIVAYADSQRCKKLNLAAFPEGPGFGSGQPDESGDRWPVEPNVGRVAHGVPRRVDRLTALGNAVVPQVVAEIGRAIMAAHILASGPNLD